MGSSNVFRINLYHLRISVNLSRGNGAWIILSSPGDEDLADPDREWVPTVWITIGNSFEAEKYCIEKFVFEKLSHLLNRITGRVVIIYFFNAKFVHYKYGKSRSLFSNIKGFGLRGSCSKINLLNKWGVFSFYNTENSFIISAAKVSHCFAISWFWIPMLTCEDQSFRYTSDIRGLLEVDSYWR